MKYNDGKKIFQVFLQCPSEKAAEENREEVLDNMLQSLRTLALLTSGELPDTTEVVEDEEGDNLAVIFKNMEVKAVECGELSL